MTDVSSREEPDSPDTGPIDDPAAAAADTPSEPSERGAEGADPTGASAEEQMARFEEALKESDWGHQPC